MSVYPKRPAVVETPRVVAPRIVPWPATVTRFVVTFINRNGMRTILGPVQGRNTFATRSEAADWVAAIVGGNASYRLAEIYGAQAVGSFEPRAVACYPGHHDPTTVWFD